MKAEFRLPPPQFIPTPHHPQQGVSWHQPKSDDIIIDEKYALMSRKDFASLEHYNKVRDIHFRYAGKIWKSHNDYDAVGVWYLHFFTDSPHDGCVTHHCREIILTD